MKECVVIIPVYKSELSDFDRQSICQTCKVLGNHTLVIIHPEGLDISNYTKEFPMLKSKVFKKEYFQGIMGYNRLMLSTDFYGAFLDYKYILICQTDAYIFRDELHSWCEKGYDYVGAPWLRKRSYNLPVLKQLMSLSLWWKHLNGKRSKQDLYNKIGNGGLSLRKTQSHYDVTINQRELIKEYTRFEKKRHLYNEDVFWALEPENFKYPSPEEALMFSFDKYPAMCYEITNNKLPMGCHAWYKRKMKHFWRKCIALKNVE